MAAAIAHAGAVGEALQLEHRGYLLVWDARDRGREPVVHLTAGMPALSA
jgi:hypothetical protein